MLVRDPRQRRLYAPSSEGPHTCQARFMTQAAITDNMYLASLRSQANVGCARTLLQRWLAILAESDIFTSFGAARETYGSAFAARVPRRKVMVFPRIGFLRACMC